MHPNKGVGPWECTQIKEWALGMYPNLKVGFWECIQIKELGPGNVSQ